MRTGMAHLVGRLRRMVDDAPLDAQAIRVWDDDELQEFLDQHRVEFFHEILYPQIGVTYFTFYTGRIYNSKYSNLEELTESDDSIFRLYDAFNVNAADYTPDYIAGRFAFTADQLGKYYYLTGRDYDLNGAAAMCWRETAGRTAKKYSISHAAGNSFSRSEWFDHCKIMEEHHRQQARMRHIRAVR